jgi:hypothetical protein
MEPDLPLHNNTRRVERAGTLFALGYALRLWKDVTIRLDSPIPIPSGVGGRPTLQFWSHVTSVVVKSEEDRAVVCTAPGLDAERVVVEPEVWASRAQPSDGWIFPDDSALRERVTEIVRQRAAADRGITAARITLGAAEVGPLAASAFSPAPRGPSAVAIARFVLGYTKRALEFLRARSAG